MMEILKNVLLISGSARNVGKTTFIRKVIEHNADQNLTAIKITPHFHGPTEGLIPIAETENYRVFEETDRHSEKDSSLFLQSGAEKVIYLQTTDLFLAEAFAIAVAQLQPNQPIITESAALRKYIIPGLYLFIQKIGEEAKPSAQEMQKLADATILSDGNEFSIRPEKVTFKQIWKI